MRELPKIRHRTTGGVLDRLLAVLHLREPAGIERLPDQVALPVSDRARRGDRRSSGGARFVPEEGQLVSHEPKRTKPFRSGER